MEAKSVVTPHPNNGIKKKKRYTIWMRLILTNTLISLISFAVIGSVFFFITRVEIEDALKQEMVSTSTAQADYVSLSVDKDFQILQNLSLDPRFQATETSSAFKSSLLLPYLKMNSENLGWFRLSLMDLAGNLYFPTGGNINIAHQDSFKVSSKGGRYVSDPFRSESTGQEEIVVMTYPVRNSAGNIISILNMSKKTDQVIKFLKEIKFRTTGTACIISSHGDMIGFSSDSGEDTLVNLYEVSEMDLGMKELVTAFETQREKFLLYSSGGDKKYGILKPIEGTNWMFFLTIDHSEVMSPLYRILVYIFFSMLAIFGLVFLVNAINARLVTKPVRLMVDLLKDISEKNGDLTVRLPIKGHNEITELSRYFNKTIEKLAFSIRSVLNTSKDMDNVSHELSSNMTETATAVNEISANIEGVKKQVISQSTSVTETTATTEEIIRTINQLNNGIESQVASIEKLMEIIEEGEKATDVTKSVLEKNDDLIDTLVQESSEGRDVIKASGQDVQKIAEESGSLLEASSIIQNIASQTNLLAMNAAIEAAHAGDSGKGFAVVADEIRKLAEESSTQGKVITKSLKTLSSEIEAVTSSSKRLDDRFTSIFVMVNEVKTMSKEIMNIVNARKEQSAKLLSLVDSVQAVTTEVKNGSAEMLKGGEQVALEMQALDAFTNVINASMNEMASGAIQINNSVQEVNSMTQHNNENIKQLSEEMCKFKV